MTEASKVNLQTMRSLARFFPEPQSRVSSIFRGLMEQGASAVGQVARNIAGIEPEYASLLQKQIDVQQQMQLVSLESNIEKSKHETQMAAVRNLRVG